ncbi:FAD-binding oxidoreductase [Nocardia crassostreae]|uniref:FAD-binding oxidoreductase n=1 Tax=Nocardia crassostreae TaxID=53428 RepID=UPI00082D64AD|nr:FAD-binding oxidoreductase [Nocardia crassostreae]
MTNLSDLRSAVRGAVLLPGDSGFDRARTPWNLTVDQPVSAVVEVADAADAAALVRYAADRKLTLAAQPSGHGASGDTEGVVLVRTGKLRELRVDPDARTARVGAGVTWGEVLTRTSPHGLLGLAGSSPGVSVTGYTLGGGISWFSRAYGWAADRVTAFEVVTADGATARVTADSDAELFWALRGGGGDFAFVTALEFDLLPAPRLYGGMLTWAGDRSEAAMEAFREITADAPDELSVWFNLVQFPGGAPMVGIELAYLGDADSARELLRPLAGIGEPVSDSRAELPIAELGTIANDPIDPGPGLSRGELLTDLGDATAKAVLAEPIAPLLQVQLRHLGGAMTRPSDSPHGPISDPYLLYTVGLGVSPEASAAIAERRQQLVDGLGATVSGRKPFGFLNNSESAANAFGADALNRLRAVKRSRDPEDRFRSNFPVLR